MGTSIFHLIVTCAYLVPLFGSGILHEEDGFLQTSGDKVKQTTPKNDIILLSTLSDKARDRSSQSYLEFGKRNTTLAVNSSLTMTCGKEANISKGFIWWFRGSIIILNGTPFDLRYGNFKVSESNTTSTLFINAMQWNNTGLYRCNVGNTTVMEHFLSVEDPQLKISCPVTDCYSVLAANVSQRYILHCYINQNPLYEPVTWKINNNVNEAIVSYTDWSNLSENIGGDMYLASTLIYKARRNHNIISCSMGMYSTNITIEVLHKEQNNLPLAILAVGIVIFTIAICVIMAVVYCISKKRKYPSRQNSITSYPNIAYENGSTTEEFDKRDEVSKRSDDGPFLIPVSDEWKRLCEQSNAFYGLKLLCCRYEDKMDVFSEAVFVDGDYKERFVVRSVSGKSTLESLEEFRKFQICLTELKNHSNVLAVLGCFTNKLPYRICYEYFPNKTVRDYLFEDFQNLQNSQMHDMQAQKLVCIAHGVANGLFFLKENQLDHVALRVEKVLYFGANICKLYDMSLRNQSKQKAIDLLEKSESLAWLGPDILLRKEYNHLTDIWAYGVLMWELWSGGQTPFNKSPRLTMEMNMRNEKMLQQPANCPGVIYSLMLSCWRKRGSERCSYRGIVTELEKLKGSVCKNVTEDNELEAMPGPSFYTTLDENTYDHLSTL